MDRLQVQHLVDTIEFKWRAILKHPKLLKFEGGKSSLAIEFETLIGRLGGISLDAGDELKRVAIIKDTADMYERDIVLLKQQKEDLKREKELEIEALRLELEHMKVYIHDLEMAAGAP
jgi:hypothetical protein